MIRDKIEMKSIGSQQSLQNYLNKTELDYSVFDKRKAKNKAGREVRK